ncbi:MAG TPA: aminopeptidase N, partial [Micromonosporaceae bacterium]
MSDAATAPAISEITRHETAERARLLDVEAYDITLDFTLSDTTFRSVSVIRFSCREPGASTHVDLVAPAVHEITLNGVAIDPAEAFRAARIALPDLAANNELRVVADCAYSHEGAGAHRAVDSADGRVYLYTKLEPAEARRVYANFEQPDLKSAFTFHVIAPDHWTVMSNQPTPAPEPRDGGLAVWHFEPTPRISTYLTAIVAGDYVVVESEHTT